MRRLSGDIRTVKEQVLDNFRQILDMKADVLKRTKDGQKSHTFTNSTGDKRITIGQDQEFLLVAEGAAVPGGVPEGVTVLQQPLDEIYLVASAAMDSFAQLDAVDCIRFSGRKESDWYIEQAKEP